MKDIDFHSFFAGVSNVVIDDLSETGFEKFPHLRKKTTELIDVANLNLIDVNFIVEMMAYIEFIPILHSVVSSVSGDVYITLINRAKSHVSKDAMVDYFCRNNFILLPNIKFLSVFNCSLDGIIPVACFKLIGVLDGIARSRICDIGKKYCDALRTNLVTSSLRIENYIFASRYIRANDRVLDLGCELGDGVDILTSSESNCIVTGVDPFPEKVSYAKDVHINDRSAFYCCDNKYLYPESEETFDVVICFDVNKKFSYIGELFYLCKNNLKLDGRLIFSISFSQSDSFLDSCWVDFFECGAIDDENIKKIIEGNGYVLEEMALHLALDKKGNNISRLNISNEFDSFKQSISGVDHGCIIVVATPDITNHTWRRRMNDAYSNSEYDLQKKLPKYLDFSSGYVRPWLHRQIVQIGQRIESDTVREKYCYRLLDTSNDFVERAMLLTIIGYSSFYKNHEDDKVDIYLSMVNEFLCSESSCLKLNHSTFNIRWMVSLRFLIASIYLKKLNFGMAKKIFLSVLEYDALSFCPVLGIKSAYACYQLVLISLHENDKSAALDFIRYGKLYAAKAAQLKFLVSESDDIVAPFLWTETAEIIDIGDLLNRVHKKIIETSSNQRVLDFFYSMHDRRRFGLFELISESRKALSKMSDRTSAYYSVVNKLCAMVLSRGWSRVVIFGSGILAKDLCEALIKEKIEVIAFVDSITRGGIGDIPILSVDDLTSCRADGVVVSSISSGEKIAYMLRDSFPCVYI